MKSTCITSAIVAIAFVFLGPANADDLGSKWAGTYSCKETNFVTVKRLSFTREKDGRIKVRGTLVGFPDEVSIGDAIAEPYSDRNNKSDPDTLIASFSSERYKPLIVIQRSTWDTEHIKNFVFTCYMKDIDGAQVHINGSLDREP